MFVQNLLWRHFPNDHLRDLMDIEIIPWEVAAGAEKVEDWQNIVSMAPASGVNMFRTQTNVIFPTL